MAKSFPRLPWFRLTRLREWLEWNLTYIESTRNLVSFRGQYPEAGWESGESLSRKDIKLGIGDPPSLKVHRMHFFLTVSHFLCEVRAIPLLSRAENIDGGSIRM